MTTTEAQKMQILRFMSEGNTISDAIARERFDCSRCGARIWELKEAGIPVQSDWEYKYDEKGRVIKKWKRYWIAKQ